MSTFCWEEHSDWLLNAIAAKHWGKSPVIGASRDRIEGSCVNGRDHNAPCNGTEESDALRDFTMNLSNISVTLGDWREQQPYQTLSVHSYHS